MARKLFISVLGTGFYEKCKYTGVENQFVSSETRFIQEATLELLKAKEWSENDKTLFLLTEDAKNKNWNEDITERLNRSTGKNVPYKGLHATLLNMGLRCKIEGLHIPDGKNGNEMWEIFNIIYEALEEEDELYLDLTHSFRYLPMLLLVLGNYAKFLKKVLVASVTYGNYEARNLEKNQAPIVNLMPLIALQDWTNAVADYLENGRVDKMAKLTQGFLRPLLAESRGQNLEARHLNDFIKILNDNVDTFQTCRGLNILAGKQIGGLKRSMQQMENIIIQPMKPVMQRMRTSLDSFTESDNIKNGFIAAKWCFDNHLYQQAVTIMHENMVSMVCQEAQLDMKNEIARSHVNAAYKIAFGNLPQQEWKIKCQNETNVNEREENDKLVKRLLELNVIKDFKDVFSQLTELRNDFNHAGYRDNPMKPETIKYKIGKYLSCILDYTDNKPCS